MRYKGGAFVLLTMREYQYLKELICETNIKYDGCNVIAHIDGLNVYISSALLRKHILELTLISFMLSNGHRILTRNLREAFSKRIYPYGPGYVSAAEVLHDTSSPGI